jgi:glutathione S-transferase
MFVGFLASTSPKIRDRFLPQESQSECDKLLAWYEARLRPSCLRLTSSITKFKQISTTANTQVSDINKEIEGLIKYYLTVLEQRLEASKSPFLAGKNLTALDILIYCELSGILVLTEK